jgi:ribosomal-protein-alanine N-acetyltransferase
VTTTATIERLEGDLVAVAQCILIDEAAFPHPSVWFGARSPDEIVWVAKSDPPARVVGFLASQVTRGILYVSGLAVERRQRKQGVGRALLRTAIHHAAERGLAGVALCVSVTNDAAFDLYDSEGFVVTRRRRDYYSSQAFGGFRDALEMFRASDRGGGGAG